MEILKEFRIARKIDISTANVPFAQAKEVQIVYRLIYWIATYCMYLVFLSSQLATCRVELLIELTLTGLTVNIDD